MVLGGAFEFNKEYNNEIILREADDVELPRWVETDEWRRRLKGRRGGEKEKEKCCYGDELGLILIEAVPCYFLLFQQLMLTKACVRIEAGNCSVN